MRLVLDHEGSRLSGSLRMTFQGTVVRDGPVSGFLIGDGTAASLSYGTGRTTACPNAPPRGDTIMMTVRLQRDKVTGFYLGFTCNGADSGTFDLGPGS
jgi:hypothetical protein